jgi:hypothetical protein
LKGGEKNMTKYIYNPGFMDVSHPIVIAGNPIKPGAVVTITKTKVDPAGWFVFVRDAFGNRQSVFKKALTKQVMDRPVPGKLYALTGGADNKNIAAGNTWAESEVRGAV